MNIFSKRLLFLPEDKKFIQPIYPDENISSDLFNTSEFAVVASSTFSSTYYTAYNLFNTLYVQGNGGNDTGRGRIWESRGGQYNINPWIKFTNPVPIKMTEIQFDFRVEFAQRVPRAVTIYGGNSDNTWTQLTSTIPFIQERTLQSVSIPTPDYYLGYYLYLLGSQDYTGPYVVTEIANLNITATYEDYS